MPIRRLVFPLLILLVLVASRQARAQANYDGVDLGGRTAMMGGAGVARGSDGATTFINPAGLSRIPGESFSFQTVAVSGTMRQLPAFLDPSGNLGVVQNTSTSIQANILPNTFCLFLDGPPREKSSHRSRHKYGICAADTESEALLFNDNRVTAAEPATGPGISHMTRLRWSRSTLAMSWALQLAARTSIGVTAKVENSRLEDQTNVTSYDIKGDTAEVYTLNQGRVAQSWDASVVIGVTHQLSNVTTIGASLASPGQHFYGLYKASSAFASSATGSQSLVQDLGDFSYNQPTNVRLGLAFAWPRFNFELNGSLFLPSQQLAVATFDRTSLDVEQSAVTARDSTRDELLERARTVVNVMAGMEAFLAPDFSLIAGVQTDFSGLPQLVSDRSPENVLFRQRKNGVHAALGVASYGTSGSLLLGLKGYYMTGEVLVGDPTGGTPVMSPVTQNELGLALIVSGQISFEAVRDTAYRAAAPLTRRSPTGPSPGGGKP